MTAEIFPEFESIPSSWKVKRLGKLVDGDRKISYGIVQPGFHDEDGIPIIRVNNIKGGRIVPDEIMKVSKKVESAYERTRLRGGELIITLVGSLGEAAIVDKQFAGWNMARAVGIIPIENRSVAEWVRFYLSSRIAKYFIGMWANTTVQHTLNLKDLSQLPVPIPPDDERDELVRTLSCIDKKIELNRKQNQTLEAIAQTLFKRWFVEFEFPDENGNVYKSSGGAMQPSEMGEIPVGWDVLPLSEITTYLSRGLTPAYAEEGGVSVLNQRCIRDGWINKEPARRHDNTKRKVVGRELQMGDVLVNSTGVGTLGRTAQVAMLDEVTIVDTHVTVVRANLNKVSAEYLGVCLRLREREIEFMAEGSTGQTELGRVKLGELPVIVPNQRQVSDFTEVAKSLMVKRAANWIESLTLSDLRDTLLPKLMSGELRVA